MSSNKDESQSKEMAKEMTKEMKKETQQNKEKNNKIPQSHFWQQTWKKFFYEISLPKKKYLPASLHLGYLVISFAVAFLLWFSVTDREEMDLQYTVALEYTNIPQDLIVTNGMEEFAHVRVRSTSSLHNILKKEELSFEANLASLQKGANVVNLELDTLFNSAKYEILSIEPEKLLLVSDKLAEKDVKIDVYISEDVKNANRIVGKPQVIPTQVRIKGSESEVNKISEINLPFTPDTDIAAGKYTESLAVKLTEHVEAIPPIVSVSYEIKSGLVTVNYIVPVKVMSKDANAQYTLSEEKVTLNVLMPDHLIRNEEFIDALSAYVVPTGAAEETVILRFKVPPTAKLQSSSIDKVVLKKIQ